MKYFILLIVTTTMAFFSEAAEMRAGNIITLHANACPFAFEYRYASPKIMERTLIPFSGNSFSSTFIATKELDGSSRIEILYPYKNQRLLLNNAHPGRFVLLAQHGDIFTITRDNVKQELIIDVRNCLTLNDQISSHKIPFSSFGFR